METGAADAVVAPESEGELAMKNVQTKVVGKKLVIEVDLSKSHGVSKSGKSEIVATTSGNVDIGNGVKLGLNCYKPVPAPVA
jgi:hypothetical protein